MEENNNNNTTKPQGENPDHKLPEGFRLVEEGEVIPAGYETRMDLTLERSITNAPKPGAAAPAQTFDPPKVLEAAIDPKQPQKETPTKFSFTTPEVIKQAQAQPTKGDLTKKETPASSDDKLTDAEKLKKLDAEIARDEGRDKKEELTFDDYKDSAETYMEMYEGALQFIALAIDKKGAPSAYEFLETKKLKLTHQLTKVLRKNPKWVAPIEILFLGNLIPATGRIIMKARNNRKDYMEQRRKEELENKPIETNKGGPDKGYIKTRGPGRPRK